MLYLVLQSNHSLSKNDSDGVKENKLRSRRKWETWRVTVPRSIQHLEGQSVGIQLWARGQVSVIIIMIRSRYIHLNPCPDFYLWRHWCRVTCIELHPLWLIDPNSGITVAIRLKIEASRHRGIIAVIPKALSGKFVVVKGVSPAGWGAYLVWVSSCDVVFVPCGAEVNAIIQVADSLVDICGVSSYNHGLHITQFSELIRCRIELDRVASIVWWWTVAVKCGCLATDGSDFCGDSLCLLCLCLRLRLRLYLCLRLRLLLLLRGLVPLREGPPKTTSQCCCSYYDDCYRHWDPKCLSFQSEDLFRAAYFILVLWVNFMELWYLARIYCLKSSLFGGGNFEARHGLPHVAVSLKGNEKKK